MKVGFIKLVHQAEWIANVVPMPKKDGKVRMCADFRDWNKACPKDDFPLPHIGVLVDNTAGSALMTFMDGFSGYNQIKMAPMDMTKTTFTTKWGIYCYTVMPFGLKNTGATYQRMATTLLLLEKHSLYRIQNMRNGKLIDLLHSQLITCTL